MKKFIYIVTVLFFAISLTSCGSSVAIQKDSKASLAGYTLKNKKELMEQKILNKKSKTIIAIP
tara:strand:+ start:15533 stop:15721 length:189 start_codon:yes stop_codon:yes gene_type:complete